MANIFLKPAAKFNPFSYQEMLAPVKSYTEAYNTLEEEMSNLDIMAEDASSKLNNPLDRELKQEALGFQKNLKEAMENLYTKGLTPDTRKTFNQLKAVYANKINPINEAYKAYQEDQKYLKKMAIEHPEILIEGAGKSVSDYIGGKSPQMMSVNADDLMNQAMAIAKTQAGRTHRQSNWTPTAGGRFLERTTEVGLNDAEFNLALAYIQNPNLTAKDLNMKEADFNKVKNNAALLNASMTDIINSPSFASLSTANKERALNSIIKGVRAGFQYDKKTNTEADPMFAYNLKAQEAAAKKTEKAKAIGSDYFLTPDSTKTKHRNRFLQTLGNNIGALSKNYESYFDNGKLKTKEQVEAEAAKMKESTPMWNVTSGPHAPYYQTQLGRGSTTYLNDYEDLKTAMSDLGLDPAKTTKEEFLKVLNGADVKGRKRAMITSNSTGFKQIQSNIERGLRNQTEVEMIVGLNGSSLGNMGTYRTEPMKYEDLLDKKGNLNILGVNMDYATGQLSASIKTDDGYIEILLPEGSTYRATDSFDLSSLASGLSAVQQGVAPVVTKDKNGNDVVVYIPLEKGYIPGTKILGSDYISAVEQDMNVILGDLFNFFGAEDIN